MSFDENEGNTHEDEFKTNQNDDELADIPEGEMPDMHLDGDEDDDPESRFH